MADQVRMLLVLGRRMEALKCAQEGQLWGPAIVIAALLGEQVLWMAGCNVLLFQPLMLSLMCLKRS